MEKRQIWNFPNPTKTSATPVHCTPFALPSNGVITLDADTTLTLTQDALFQPECTGSTNILISNGDAPTSIAGFRDPFYASTVPECYALATATVIAYMLVIMLLITPRAFLQEGAVVLGRRGFTNGPSGGDSITGIGGRPWLQKVAALSVAVSLTIATADTFKVAEQQYDLGLMDTQTLQEEVERSLRLKVIRIISDTFLWLAQAQTLIRLFPRQREKVIIKWTAFALICLNVLFSSLDSFIYYSSSRPRSFVDAIPALSYLFELSLSLLYCAWVIYYSITKRRFAFYHTQMKNIFIVAILSLVAVLVPVVFFVLDISKPTLAGWGDYFRWVGAAAASVVVWEWVERIEALERNEKKDGVLGREVFDGDEMLEVTPSAELQWPRYSKDDKDGGGGAATGNNGLAWSGRNNIAQRYKPYRSPDVDPENALDSIHADTTTYNRAQPALWPARPEPTATPFSRTDTASAESTIYAIRYHPINGSTPPIAPDRSSLEASREDSLDAIAVQRIISGDRGDRDDDMNKSKTEDCDVELVQDARIPSHSRRAWETLAGVNPFRRKAQGPPKEVFAAHTAKANDETSRHDSTRRWDIRAKLEHIAATHADRFWERTRPSGSSEHLPVTVIPAPPRRRDLSQLLEDPESDNSGTGSSEEARPEATDPQLGAPARQTGTPEHTNPIRDTQQARSSGPYTHDRAHEHPVTPRSGVTFVNSVQQERERRQGGSSASLEGTGSRQSRNSNHSRADGLPFVSVPAPPRNSRNAS